MLDLVDQWLNRVTLYRLTLYFLSALVVWALILSVLGALPYRPTDIVISVAVLVGAALGINELFTQVLGASHTLESTLISALILALIVPVEFPKNIWFLIAAAALASGSKYLLTIDKQHLFNPAAVAVAGISILVPNYAATWWVGSPVMLPLVAVGGLLVLRKMRREHMVLAFLVVYLGLIAASSYFHQGAASSVVPTIQFSFLHSAVLFFALVMLTEPSTLPPTRILRIVYAVVIAGLYAIPQIGVGIDLPPEFALCLGNLLSYIVRPKYRFALTLRRKRKVTPDTYAFEFNLPQHFSFAPGQYMEWTLPHSHSDSRGSRRFFTIASSPKERNLMIAVKFPEQCSSYKEAMLDAQRGDTIIAARLAGDFVLPKNLQTPLAFIAGGVGIAPFRSMVQYILDNKRHCDIVLLYANRCPEDIAFQDCLEKARPLGVKTLYFLTGEGAPAVDGWTRQGRITPRVIRQEVPDFQNRTFYIAGPQLMVRSCEMLLKGTGVKGRKIITDYFPGYVEASRAGGVV